MHCKVDSDGNPAIISRPEARTEGFTHYFTGKPCINGHTEFRSVAHKLCLGCHRDRRARTRREKPELVRAQKAADYTKHREERLAQVAAYSQSPEGRETRAEYRIRNRERINQRARDWMRANRAAMRPHEKRRRDRKRAAGLLKGKHTFAEVAALFAAQGELCANDRCSIDLNVVGFHEDHKLAISLGGTDDIANIQLLCPTCNLRKGSLSPEEWEQRRHAEPFSIKCL